MIALGNIETSFPASLGENIMNSNSEKENESSRCFVCNVLFYGGLLLHLSMI